MRKHADRRSDVLKRSLNLVPVLSGGLGRVAVDAGGFGFAMAAHRPYRAGLGLAAALEEVRANIGTGFDASIAEACLALIEERRFDFDAGEERVQHDEHGAVPAGAVPVSRSPGREHDEKTAHPADRDPAGGGQRS